MADFYLLSKPNCGLCDEALALLHRLDLEQPMRLHWVDISQQPELWDEYALLIPVLVRAKDDAELRWPFGEQLMEFVTA
ncbi:glutaredoxin family protein [Pseudidiomarina sediminum]|uniref:Glutaredoxin family protein n=1 Tax=Pseudidiomarina sediminum TaxID=431675 RepID=A0A432Z7T1_9GAMM|nr:glutaredoxin family protein [Pseudidiomarina sediminum]MBY6063079.1 glutaredoxin family protein [Pseudidiomarina sediminum]RUO73933.1 glutaredoxin family protein [Pseudidiomarina sediminum]